MPFRQMNSVGSTCKALNLAMVSCSARISLITATILSADVCSELRPDERREKLWKSLWDESNERWNKYYNKFLEFMFFLSHFLYYWYCFPLYKTIYIYKQKTILLIQIMRYKTQIHIYIFVRGSHKLIQIEPKINGWVCLIKEFFFKAWSPADEQSN